MKILIAGGTGFIGQALVTHFLTDRHQVTVLGRSKATIQKVFADQPVHALAWDALSQDHIDNQDIIINLCGAGVADKRWSHARKQTLLDSRILPTTQLAQLCAQSDNPPSLFNASAIGTYGLQSAAQEGLPIALDESTNIDFSAEPDFLATIGRRWETATQPARDAGVRVVLLRFGVVLGPGGAIAQLKLPYQLGLGGPIGDGRQPFCWVSLADLVNAVDFLIQTPQINGPVNIVSPNTVTQKTFAQTFARALKRPAILPTFSWIIKLVFGQMGEEALLRGQHVTPKILTNHGFTFSHPDLLDALNLALDK